MYRLGIRATPGWRFSIISKTLVQGPHSRSAEGVRETYTKGTLMTQWGLLQAVYSWLVWSAIPIRIHFACSFLVSFYPRPLHKLKKEPVCPGDIKVSGAKCPVVSPAVLVWFSTLVPMPEANFVKYPKP